MFRQNHLPPLPKIQTNQYKKQQQHKTKNNNKKQVDPVSIINY